MEFRSAPLQGESGVTNGGALAPRGRLRVAAGVLFLAGAVASAVVPLADRRLRRGAEAVVRLAALDRNSSEEAREIALETAGDLAAAMAASAALTGPPAARRAAADLMLTAISTRPGRAYPRYLLALSEADPLGERARRVLRLAADAAPGLDVIWFALARADLAAWTLLAPTERAKEVKVFGRCLQSEEFSSTQFAAVSKAIGRTRAVALLPDEGPVLSSAAASLAAGGDVPGAAILLPRAEEAERRDRVRELTELERRHREGDTRGVARGCRTWFDRHPFGEFDDAAGRRQLALLLGLWPDEPGSWSADRRARLVRFFLDGRADDVAAETLLRAIQRMDGVPDPVLARILLLLGDATAAEALAERSGQTASPERDACFLELARRAAREGETTEAFTALARLSASAGQGCDALLVRRDLLRALRSSEGLPQIEQKIEALGQVSSEDWSTRHTLEVCVDPEVGRGAAIEFEAGPGAPALLAWGWNGGRTATVALSDREESFRVPLSGRRGQCRLWVAFLAGGEGRSLKTSLRKLS